MNNDLKEHGSKPLNRHIVGSKCHDYRLIALFILYRTYNVEYMLGIITWILYNKNEVMKITLRRHLNGYELTNT